MSKIGENVLRLLVHAIMPYWEVHFLKNHVYRTVAFQYEGRTASPGASFDHNSQYLTEFDDILSKYHDILSVVLN